MKDKEKLKETRHKYYLEHKEEFKERAKKWFSENGKEIRNTPKYRAISLVNSYKQFDKKHNYGVCNLTSDWIVENIFSKPCAHCGKEGWKVIGCNRLDNSKPHTIDNVEPCCKECNDKLQKDDIKKKVYQYELVPRLVKIWDSAKDTEIDGYEQTGVRACCRGIRETHKGYKWSYKPL